MGEAPEASCDVLAGRGAGDSAASPGQDRRAVPAPDERGALPALCRLSPWVPDRWEAATGEGRLLARSPDANFDRAQKQSCTGHPGSPRPEEAVGTHAGTRRARPRPSPETALLREGNLLSPSPVCAKTTPSPTELSRRPGGHSLAVHLRVCFWTRSDPIHRHIRLCAGNRVSPEQNPRCFAVSVCDREERTPPA